MAIMAKRRALFTGGVHYIDGFSGTGELSARDEERRIDGSPLIALSLPDPFDSYTFIELDPWRAEKLREVCARYPHLNTRVIAADCNEVIVNEVTPSVRWERFARGFVFLDPFGMNLEFATIEAIAETRALEVIINLPTMAMNRNGLPNDPRKLTPLHFLRMDRLWGDRSWYDLIYEERPGLWGPEPVKVGTTGTKRLGQLFKRHRLEPIFNYVGEPLVVPNSSGVPIYCLIHASPNETGAKIARDVFGSARSIPVPEATTLPLFAQMG